MFNGKCSGLGYTQRKDKLMKEKNRPKIGGCVH